MECGNTDPRRVLEALSRDCWHAFVLFPFGIRRAYAFEVGPVGRTYLDLRETAHMRRLRDAVDRLGAPLLEDSLPVQSATKRLANPHWRVPVSSFGSALVASSCGSAQLVEVVQGVTPQRVDHPKACAFRRRAQLPIGRDQHGLGASIHQCHCQGGGEVNGVC